MHSIVLRDPNDPYSLCDINSAGWHVDAASFDPQQLSEVSADINLISNKYPGINMTLSLRLGGNESKILNMKIKPSDSSGISVFEVPDDIVDVQGALTECWGSNCNLYNFVKIDMKPIPDQLVKVINGDVETPVDIW